MALFHSPKTSTDGLVFMYDTGNRKSYPGEPTTNFVTNPDFSTGDLTGWSSTSTSNSDVDITEVSSENGYNYFHKKVNKTANGGQDRLVESSTYNIDTSKQTTISIDIWINPENDYSIIFYARGTTADDTTYDEKPLQNNGSTTSTVDLGGGWVRYIYTLQTAWYTGSGTSFRIAIYPGYGGRGLMEYKVRQVQVEQKPHATPFVNGTRSATQGLIDRTGTSTIDISNTSFDSNAQMTFDGTDDYITLGSDSVLQDIGSFATIECWFKSSSLVGSKFAIMVGWGDGTSYYSNFGIGNWFSAWSDESIYVGINSAAVVYAERDGSAKYHDGNWHHAVALMGHNNHKIYVDGSEVSVSFAYGSNSVSTSKLFGFSSGTEVYIGLRPYGNGHFQGDLPVVKIYNRLLSDYEILQNYNATKSRFGL